MRLGFRRSGLRFGLLAESARLIRIAGAVSAFAAIAVGLVAATYASAAAKPPYTVAVTPTSVGAGSSGNRLTFTFTATASVQGLVSVGVPAVASGSAWSKPQSSNPSSPGYVSAAKGTCNSAAVQGVSGPTSGPWTVVVNTKCSKGKSFTLTYGGTGAGGVTAATKSGPYTFTAKAQAGGSFLNLASQPVVTVTPGAAASLAVEALVDATAGNPYQGMAVTAKDQYGNTATGYRGTVAFSLSGPPPANPAVTDQSTIPDPYTFTANNQGVAVFTNQPSISLTTAGAQTVTATDTATSSITGSQTVTISPGGPASIVMGPLPDQEVVITGLFTHQHVTVTAYDAYGNLAATTPFVDNVNFNIDMHGQTCDLTIHLFCGVSGAGAEFENSVTSDDVAYYDPSGGQVTLSATLFHDGVNTATVSHTINYVPTGPTANAVAIQDQNIPTLYDIQVPDPLSTAVNLIQPDLTVTHVQQQLDGTLLVTATGSSLTTLQPVTLTFQTTTPVDITTGTLEPTDAPSVGDNITVTQWVNGAATYCGDASNPCATVPDQQAGVIFQSDSGSGYAVSAISDLLRVDSEAIVQVTPATAAGRFDFGIVPDGTSKPQTFTLTNRGYDDVYVQSFNQSHNFLFPDPFPITNNNCADVTLYSGGVQSSCTATITADGTKIGGWNCPDVGYTFHMSRNPDPVTAVPFTAEITIGGCDH